MKREIRHNFLIAWVLSFLISWGTLGCLISAFDLNLEHTSVPILICGISSLFCSALFSIRYGSWLLICLLVPGLGWLHRDGRLVLQLQQFLHHLTTIYDRAYGLGVFPLPEGADASGFVDFPLGFVGVLIAIGVCWCICCRKTLWLPVAVTLLPLCSCIVVTDTVPGERWLFLVMTGLLLLILPQGVRRENTVQGNRLTAAAALPVILALGLLFLTTPQESYVNQSAVLRDNILTAAQNLPRLMESGMNQIASGLQKQPDRQVDLAGLGERIPFTYPVMEVTAERSGPLYLREQDYDCYDGLRWTASEDRKETFSGVSGERETIRIQTEYRKKVRYVSYYPAKQSELVDGHGENPKQETEYTLLRSHLPQDWRQTAYRNTAETPGTWEQYCSLPELTNAEAVKLLEGLYSETASNTEKADSIAAFVTDAARYSLKPGRMPPSEPDFALWFLREAENGYCIHFATAATVLLRAAGVPARYVTGYLAEARAGQTVSVTEEDAHAWAEYYEPNLGIWLPLEVTPAENMAPQSIPSRPVTEVPTEPPQTVPETTEYSTEPPAETLPTVPAATEFSEPELPPVQKAKSRLSGGILVLPVFVLVLMLQRSARLRLRRKLQRTGDVNKQALYRWREALRLSRLLKESPTEELIVLAQKAKFSQHELTAEELLLFDSFSRTCLRRLKGKPWYLRLIYQYFYAAW